MNRNCNFVWFDHVLSSYSPFAVHVFFTFSGGDLWVEKTSGSRQTSWFFEGHLFPMYPGSYVNLFHTRN